MSRPLRLLVFTPWVPYPLTGACIQDRFYGFKQMQALGYDIHVVAKIHDFQPRAEVENFYKQEGISLEMHPYVKDRMALVRRNIPNMLTSFAYLDGAALEYTDFAFQHAARAAVERFRPDVIWIEYSFCWPLLRLLKPFGIPMIMKSSLNEPYNCRDENGWSLVSILKSLPKYSSETIAACESDFIFGITPVEEQWYRDRGAKRAGTLPLRGLSRCLTKRTHAEKDVLDVVFLSSNYNMGHNRDAMLFLLERVLPLVRKQASGKFRFHLTGNKFPEKYRSLLGDDARTTGFLPDIGEFLSTMDIALCPWISGHGMQQKVFEPLCRSIPLITTKTNGYPFVPGTEVLLATTPEEYVQHLMSLSLVQKRQAQADAAYSKAQQLFGEEVLKGIIDSVIKSLIA